MITEVIQHLLTINDLQILSRYLKIRAKVNKLYRVDIFFPPCCQVFHVRSRKHGVNCYLKPNEPDLRTIDDDHEAIESDDDDNDDDNDDVGDENRE